MKQFPNALMEGVAAHNNFEGTSDAASTILPSNLNLGDGSQSRQDHHFGEYLDFHEETWEHVRHKSPILSCTSLTRCCL